MLLQCTIFHITIVVLLLKIEKYVVAKVNHTREDWKMLEGYCEERDKLLSMLNELINRTQGILCPDDLTRRDLKSVEETANKPFYILFMGYRCGKTSMINALLGEDFFPAYWNSPTVAMIELHYGPEKMIVYPRKGNWPDDRPFSILNPTVDQIAQYLSIDGIVSVCEADGENIQLTGIEFEKIVIYWPHEYLKNGIVLVDSPELCDEYEEEKQYIFENYVTKVDAIVYLMDGQRAGTNCDKETLAQINAFGQNQIIIAYTHADLFFRRCKPEMREKLKRYLHKWAEPFTSLSESGVHYVDSVAARVAKENGDLQSLQKSGYAEFEKYLESYLLETSGKARLARIRQYCEYYADKLKNAEEIC